MVPHKNHISYHHAPGRDDEGVRSQRVGAGTAQDVHLTFGRLGWKKNMKRVMISPQLYDIDEYSICISYIHMYMIYTYAYVCVCDL